MKKFFITLAVLGVLIALTSIWSAGTGTFITCNEGGVGQGFYLGIHSCQWALILLAAEAVLLFVAVRYFIQAGPANVWAAVKKQKMWIGAVILVILVVAGILYWNELMEDRQSQINYYKNLGR